jgi:hypothetical protein
MTLEASFVELDKKLEHLEQKMDYLLWAVVQGQPEAGPGHTLADRYDAAASDFMGGVKEAREAAAAGRKAAKNPLALSEARQALITCQAQFNQLLSRFYGDLFTFDRIDALNELADERKNEWAKWVYGVKDAMSQCPQPLDNVGQALFRCWQDLTERVGLQSVSAQAVSIGPQIHSTRKKASKKREA